MFCMCVVCVCCVHVLCMCVVYLCCVHVLCMCVLCMCVQCPCNSYELNCHQSFFSPFFWKHTMHSCVTCMLSYMNTVQWTIGMDTVQWTIVYSHSHYHISRYILLTLQICAFSIRLPLAMKNCPSTCLRELCPLTCSRELCLLTCSRELCP